MDFFMSKEIRSALGAAFNCAQKIFLEAFVPNRKIRRVLKGNFAKSYLKKYVQSACRPDRPRPEFLRGCGVLKIWQYWEQGRDSAPELVKACLKSVEKNSSGHDIVFLSGKDVENYVDIPPHIYDLKRRGVITPAHFSDILRSALLLRHGGTWIDSTVMLSSGIPAFVADSDLFVFSNNPSNDLDGLDMASYFIHSSPGNPIIADTLETMYAYWRENSFLKNYFLFLHAFSMVSRASKANALIREGVPFFSFENAQYLESILSRPFDSALWDKLKSCSFAHKLSHKEKILSKGGNFRAEGTFYDILISKSK